MEYVIDGAKMADRRAAHEEIAGAMCFPEYYGHNLDALFDMLSTFEGHVSVKNVPAALNALGSYGLSLLKTFYDAAEENRRFTFTIE
ncbi:MAG: barstar family protein [Clostridia bacterium]|nr:barstar family protein [Clostridia bacterium]MBQ2434242.1 barstar family protein [Clostridia bacterium]MBQ5770767.1 barstar family protein [Clostridia bacterium]